jgi:hypothetical protein
MGIILFKDLKLKPLSLVLERINVYLCALKLFVMKMRITEKEYIKAHRRASRKEEIARHGKLISGRCKVEKSKRTYDRKRAKAGMKSLPFDFYTCYLSYICSMILKQRIVWIKER